VPLVGEPHRYLMLRLDVADFIPLKQSLTCALTTLNQRLITVETCPVYNRGRSRPPRQSTAPISSPQTEHGPDLVPIPRTPRGRGHYSPPILSEMCTNVAQSSAPAHPSRNYDQDDQLAGNRDYLSGCYPRFSDPAGPAQPRPSELLSCGCNPADMFLIWLRSVFRRQLSISAT
jgi:hypothetical protein